MSIGPRAEQMQEYIKSGRILDAINEFYAHDCAMQENGSAPTVGRDANIEREKQFLAQVKEWKGYTVKVLATTGDTSLVECAMDFVHVSGAPVHMEQVAVQRWKDGRIIHERFYYDASGK